MTKDLDAATIAAIRANAPTVHNGTYTVSHPRLGHFTVKVWTATNGSLAGRRLISLLTGPSNETDWTAVAFWDDKATTVSTWRRFRGMNSHAPINGYHWQKEGWSIYEQKLAIWCDLAVRGATEEKHGYWWNEGYQLLRESRCCACNRKLTHPESIEAGIGPECAKRG